MPKHWTPHDFDACSDPEILKIRARFGLKGYGAYWVLIEQLGMSKDHNLSLDENSIGALSVITCEPYDQMESFIRYCIDSTTLFGSDGQTFWSDRLCEEMRRYDKLVAQKSKAGKASAAARSEQMLNTRSTGDKQVLNERSTNTIQHNTIQKNTKEKNKDSSQQAVSPFTFRLKNGEVFQLTEELYRTYIETYHEIDVHSELKRASAWLESNPSKRKTRAGMPKFLNGWLARCKPDSTDGEDHTKQLLKEMGLT